MLLRNLDTQYGLHNGTRLIITKMGKFVLEGKIISGSKIGDKVQELGAITRTCWCLPHNAYLFTWTIVCGCV
jgi:hypothetical protein